MQCTKVSVRKGRGAVTVRTRYTKLKKTQDTYLRNQRFTIGDARAGVRAHGGASDETYDFRACSDCASDPPEIIGYMPRLLSEGA